MTDACRNGHAYDEANTYWYRGARQCRACNRAAQVRRRGVGPTCEQRFWSKVDKRGPDECWHWQGARDPAGYGVIGGQTNGVKHNKLAHRMSWAFATKSDYPPKSRYVCHTCDTPSCVNPAHLWLGSCAENVADMLSKGRNWQSRVTHCPRGHAYTPDNTRPVKTRAGRFGRACIQCERDRTQRRIADRLILEGGVR
jgi:hypothetical protein